MTPSIMQAMECGKNLFKMMPQERYYALQTVVFLHTATTGIREDEEREYNKMLAIQEAANKAFAYAKAQKEFCDELVARLPKPKK